MTMLAHRQLPLRTRPGNRAPVWTGSFGFVQRKGSLAVKVRETGKDQPRELPAGAVALLMDKLGRFVEDPQLWLACRRVPNLQ